MAIVGAERGSSEVRRLADCLVRALMASRRARFVRPHSAPSWETYREGVTHSGYVPNPVSRSPFCAARACDRGSLSGDSPCPGGAPRDMNQPESGTPFRATFLWGVTVFYNAWSQPGESGSRLLPTRPPGVGSGPFTRAPQPRVCRGTGTRPIVTDRVLAGPSRGPSSGRLSPVLPERDSVPSCRADEQGDM